MLHNNKFGYEDFGNVDLGNVEDMEKAIEYYKGQLVIADDEERNWLLGKISKLEFKIDELNGVNHDWVNLFK